MSRCIRYPQPGYIPKSRTQRAEIKAAAEEVERKRRRQEKDDRKRDKEKRRRERKEEKRDGKKEKSDRKKRKKEKEEKNVEKIVIPTQSEETGLVAAFRLASQSVSNHKDQPRLTNGEVARRQNGTHLLPSSSLLCTTMDTIRELSHADQHPRQRNGSADLDGAVARDGDGASGLLDNMHECPEPAQDEDEDEWLVRAHKRRKPDSKAYSDSECKSNQLSDEMRARRGLQSNIAHEGGTRTTERQQMEIPKPVPEAPRGARSPGRPLSVKAGRKSKKRTRKSNLKAKYVKEFDACIMPYIAPH